MATAQDWATKAGAAARAGKDAAAAECYREAAQLHHRAGEHMPAVMHALCAVTAMMRTGNLDAAEDDLDGLEKEIPRMRGIEDHVHETIRSRRAQIEAMRKEQPKASDLVHRGPVPEVRPIGVAKGEAKVQLLADSISPEDTPLGPQDIVDRAAGVGVAAKIEDDGHAWFLESFTVRDGEGKEKAQQDALNLVTETLREAGLTTDYTAIFGDKDVRGRIVPLPANSPDDARHDEPDPRRVV